MVINNLEFAFNVLSGGAFESVFCRLKLLLLEEASYFENLEAL